MTKLSENIKKYREINNLTQDEFAAKLNVSRQAVSKWETGRSYPNYEILTEISKLIDVKIEDLLTKEDIVKETLNVKNKNNRNLILIIILSIIAFIGVLIGIISIIISINNKKKEKDFEHEDSFYGFVVFLAGFDDYGRMTEPTLEEFKQGKYPGIYCFTFENGDMKPTYSMSFLFHRASSVEEYLIDTNGYTFEVTFSFNTYGFVRVHGIYADKNSNDFYISKEPIITPMALSSSKAFESFHYESNGKKYNCSFTYLVKEQSRETKIIEYNSKFEPINETLIDINELEEIAYNPVMKKYDYKVSQDCLFIVIEDKLKDDIERRIIWREDLDTNVILYYTDDFYFSNRITLLRK